MTDKAFRIGAIVAARMGSTRFPAKAMADLCGKPLLQHVLDRIPIEKMVATTWERQDNAIHNWCLERGIKCFRGDPYNVLERVYHAAKNWGVDGVVRVNGDCPLVSAELVSQVATLAQRERPDYVYCLVCSPYSDTSDGRTGVLTKAGVPEYVSSEMLGGILEHIGQCTEHVTWPLHTPLSVRSLHVVVPWHGTPQTVDTPEDLERIRQCLQSTVAV